LVLLLHGAGATAQHGLSLLVSQADDVGLVLVALSSQGETWDVLLGGYGPDVTRIDRALQQVFGRVAVDPAHLAVGGFSDGASYGLSLGLVNGDLFSEVLAFSPGFVAPGDRHGAPCLFISHGIDDRLLPIDACSRVLVPRLRRAGYRVRGGDGAVTQLHRHTQPGTDPQVGQDQGDLPPLGFGTVSCLAAGRAWAKASMQGPWPKIS